MACRASTRTMHLKTDTHATRRQFAYCALRTKMPFIPGSVPLRQWITMYNMNRLKLHSIYGELVSVDSTRDWSYVTNGAALATRINRDLNLSDGGRPVTNRKRSSLGRKSDTTLVVKARGSHFLPLHLRAARKKRLYLRIVVHCIIGPASKLVPAEEVAGELALSGSLFLLLSRSIRSHLILV